MFCQKRLDSVNGEVAKTLFSNRLFFPVTLGCEWMLLKHELWLLQTPTTGMETFFLKVKAWALLKKIVSFFYFWKKWQAKMSTCSVEHWVAEMPQHTGSVSALLQLGFVPLLFTLGRCFTQNGIPQDAETTAVLALKNRQAVLQCSFQQEVFFITPQCIMVRILSLSF